MKVVTACDAGYFDFLLYQVVSCKGFLGILPTIYDLGLKEQQREFLALAGAQILRPPRYPKPGTHYPDGYRPTALFKPAIVLDFAYRNAGPILWLDADARPVSAFDFPDVELALTRAHPKVLESFEGTTIAEYVGPYHTSVIFLGDVPHRLEFLQAWATDIANDELPSDMKSMNRLCAGDQLRLTELDESVWNSTTKYPETKILHVQGPVTR